MLLIVKKKICAYNIHEHKKFVLTTSMNILIDRELNYLHSWLLDNIKPELSLLSSSLSFLSCVCVCM